MNYRSKILGFGAYLPPNCISNDDLTKIMDTSNEWIVQRTGIKQRYWVNPEQSTSDLGLQAAQRALEATGTKKEEIDLLLMATVSPDHQFPGTVCFLQAKLGIPGIPTIDVRQQCTGFIYGLSIADQFIRTGMYKKVLLVAGEVQSKGMDKTTRGRDIGVLFGDGAGACVLTRVESNESQKQESMVLSTHLHSDGEYARELWVPHPGSAYAPEQLSLEAIQAGDHLPKMNGKTVFVHASRRMPEAVHEAVNANGYSLEDVDLFIFHQANLRINEMVAKQLGIPESKVFNTIDRFANTTSATIPLGFDAAIKEGKLKKGMLVAVAAFGSGFTWGSALIRW